MAFGGRYLLLSDTGVVFQCIEKRVAVNNGSSNIAYRRCPGMRDDVVGKNEFETRTGNEGENRRKVEREANGEIRVEQGITALLYTFIYSPVPGGIFSVFSGGKRIYMDRLGVGRGWRGAVFSLSVLHREMAARVLVRTAFRRWCREAV